MYTVGNLSALPRGQGGRTISNAEVSGPLHSPTPWSAAPRDIGMLVKSISKNTLLKNSVESVSLIHFALKSRHEGFSKGCLCQNARKPPCYGTAFCFRRVGYRFFPFGIPNNFRKMGDRTEGERRMMIFISTSLLFGWCHDSICQQAPNRASDISRPCPCRGGTLDKSRDV